MKITTIASVITIALIPAMFSSACMAYTSNDVESVNSGDVASTTEVQNDTTTKATTVSAEAIDAVTMSRFDDSPRYFVGIIAGSSKLNGTDIATLGSESQEASSPDASGFGGLSIGRYSANGGSRIYYSYEQHSADTTFDSALSYSTKTSLHLLNADRIFRADKSVNPFIGLHFGYGIAKSDSELSSGYKDSGLVFGLQAGVAWRASEQFTIELGLRHTVLPDNSKEWSATSGGNTYKFQSTQSTLSSAYLGANYRF
ncbi:hypothetical protein C9J48_12475 [Photobacterium profundum]|uniref:Uncharacterized protein n=1 Tax=Photobacterium profundum 3TCK TaxID=314280 RepID=Q1Z647_9GAMM|nr:outer membrane beta-barrel protein [Photobacterium profundum]EAS43997.1 hypothetical protein P3TCK_12451 [Photobacterium profundum 3TCK]PSV61811.1 hypothetical protein C9J48_12475 [Photobacterium profundum]